MKIQTKNQTPNRKQKIQNVELCEYNWPLALNSRVMGTDHEAIKRVANILAYIRVNKKEKIMLQFLNDVSGKTLVKHLNRQKHQETFLY